MIEKLEQFPRPKLKDDDGNICLPLDGGVLLDSIMLYITDEIQKGVDVKEIIHTIHVTTGFWEMNVEMLHAAVQKETIN